MNFIKELLLATRPWSFTATLVPILVTAAVTQTSFLNPTLYRALFMGLFVHAGANLTNTYYDYLHGVDTKQHNHDPTLVERKLSPTVLNAFSLICYSAGILLIVPSFMVNSPHRKEMIILFSIGMVLSFFYTADPVGLKYRALGDVTIFICFGPLLMQCVSLMLTNEIHSALFYYTIPIGLLTEAILHANNARDIKNDVNSGIITLASLVGLETSYHIYCLLLVCAYLSVAWISYYFHYGCVLSLFTAPLALDLMKKFKTQKMANLVEETAQLHLPFGLGLFVGILSTSQGIHAFFS